MIRRLWASPWRWGYVSLMGIAALAILGGLYGDSDYWSAAGGALGVMAYWIWVETHEDDEETVDGAEPGDGRKTGI